MQISIAIAEQERVPEMHCSIVVAKNERAAELAIADLNQ